MWIWKNTFVNLSSVCLLSHIIISQISLVTLARHRHQTRECDDVVCIHQFIICCDINCLNCDNWDAVRPSCLRSNVCRYFVNFHPSYTTTYPINFFLIFVFIIQHFKHRFVVSRTYLSFNLIHFDISSDELQLIASHNESVLSNDVSFGISLISSDAWIVFLIKS